MCLFETVSWTYTRALPDEFIYIYKTVLVVYGQQAKRGTNVFPCVCVCNSERANERANDWKRERDREKEWERARAEEKTKTNPAKCLFNVYSDFFLVLIAKKKVNCKTHNHPLNTPRTHSHVAYIPNKRFDVRTLTERMEKSTDPCVHGLCMATQHPTETEKCKANE